MENSYSIVIPSRGVGSTYNLFLKYSLPLYEKYLVKDFFFEFIIICPEENITKVKDDMSTFNLNFKLYSDNEFITNEIRNIKDWGHQLQQIIKLLVSKVVKTKYYFILDDDMILNTYLQYNDLFESNKICYGYDEYPNNSRDFQFHHLWLDGSCDVIGIDLNQFKQHTDIMGVTPQLFIKDIVKELIEYVGGEYKIAIAILEKTANEFGLYWCFLIKTNRTNLYIKNNKYFLMDDSIHILHSCSNEELINRIHNGYNSKKNIFTVIQSHLRYPEDILSYSLEKAINNK
jgi:hypothetical protein